jgi:hypothetical protein
MIVGWTHTLTATSAGVPNRRRHRGWPGQQRSRLASGSASAGRPGRRFPHGMLAGDPYPDQRTPDLLTHGPHLPARVVVAALPAYPARSRTRRQAGTRRLREVRQCYGRAVRALQGGCGLPVNASLSGIEGSALCGPPFSQVALERQGRRDAFLQPHPDQRTDAMAWPPATYASNRSPARGWGGRVGAAAPSSGATVVRSPARPVPPACTGPLERSGPLTAGSGR